MVSLCFHSASSATVSLQSSRKWPVKVFALDCCVSPRSPSLVCPKTASAGSVRASDSEAWNDYGMMVMDFVQG